MIDDYTASDLDIVDYLEVFNSTVEVARILGISQSSCSRRYRAFGHRYGINFDRVDDRYQATANLDVLSSLRQASQRLRVRQYRPRICQGWQLGALHMPDLQSAGVVLPIRTMNAWLMLSLLEQRLVDVAIMGLIEFEGMLGQPLSRMRARPMPLSPSMLCMPIVAFDLKLMAHCEHPLQSVCAIDPEQLAQYPSPALQLGMAPRLMDALQNHGLANLPCGLHDYDEDRWDGLARDGVALSYAAPHRVPSLSTRFGLKPLTYDLGIRECIGFVGHRDALMDPGFTTTARQCLGTLQSSLNGHGVGLQWLS